MLNALQNLKSYSRIFPDKPPTKLTTAIPSVSVQNKEVGEAEENSKNANLPQKNEENSVLTEDLEQNKTFSAENSKKEISSERLLGELLRFARGTGEMKFLMLLREVKSLSVNGSEVTIWADEEICDGLDGGRYKEMLVDYFSKRELSLKISCTENKENKEKLIAELNRLCGGKLKVK